MAVHAVLLLLLLCMTRVLRMLAVLCWVRGTSATACHARDGAAAPAPPSHSGRQAHRDGPSRHP